MILSHRIRLSPTAKQDTALLRSVGCARFTYNWALAEWKRQHEAGEKPTASKLKKQFNSIKREQFPWVLESPKDANQTAFSHLGRAFKKFFAGETSYPTYKKRGRRDSFYMSNDHIVAARRHLLIYKIGKIRTFEPLRFSGKIMSCTVSREAGKWYASIAVDVGDLQKSRESNGVIGVDLGLKSTLVLSGGQVLQAPRPLKTQLKKLQRLSRSHSRKTKGSNNRKKSAQRLARLHARIAHIRHDFAHKTTTDLCRKNHMVVIEDLNVRGLMSSRKMGLGLPDSALGELRRQLVYKSQIYGTKLVVADRWFPSSKTCSGCGVIKKDLTLRDRVYRCDSCGLEIDRDLNAALNLRTLGLRGTHACGQDGSAPAMDATSLAEAGTKPCMSTT